MVSHYLWLCCIGSITERSDHTCPHMSAVLNWFSISVTPSELRCAQLWAESPSSSFFLFVQIPCKVASGWKHPPLSLVRKELYWLWNSIKVLHIIAVNIWLDTALHRDLENTFCVFAADNANLLFILSCAAVLVATFSFIVVIACRPHHQKGSQVESFFKKSVHLRK